MVAPLTDSLLTTLTESIVRTANPRMIVLFGSYARGTADAGSDIALLIVEDRPFGPAGSRRLELGRIQRELPALPVGVDVLLYDPQEVERWREATNHIIRRVLHECKVLYERS